METGMSSPKIHYWLIFQQDQLLLLTTPNTPPFPSQESIHTLETHFLRQHLLMEDENTCVYCAELPENFTLSSTLSPLPLRRALETIGDAWFVLAAKAYSIIHWDKNHRYCGRCGQATTHKTDTFERMCPTCSLTFYPRISPSVIVLIRKGDEVLMARGAHFTPGAYGFIAGFVEAGESIEDAVHREVMEEVGIRVTNLQYFGSQAWPFPDSLMFAFTADHESGELCIDHRELEDAGWYHYQALPGRPSTKLSIASKLLDHYLKEKTHEHSR
jgi:NAD+ diphosphatase